MHQPQATTFQTTQNRIPALDGLRGIACLLVLVGHFNSPQIWSLYPAQLFMIVHLSASQAVMLFFALSAFLLTYLACEELKLRGEFSARRFLIRRAFRIWPVYYCVVLLELFYFLRPWGPFGGHPIDRVHWMLSHAWMYLTFVSNWSISVNFLWHLDVSSSALAVLWTIAVEEQFYLLFPFVFLLVGRSSDRTKVAVVSSIFGFSVLWKLVLFSIPLLYGENTNRANDPIYYSTFSYFDVFVAAATAGWIAASIESFGRVKAMLTARWSGTVVLLLVLSSIMAWKYGYHLPHDHKTILLPLSIPVIAITFAVTILWLFLNSQSLAARLLADDRLRTIGVLSFGIYIWHSTAGSFMNLYISYNAGAPGFALDALWTIRFFAFFFYAIVLSLLSYRFIERPALALRARLYSEGRISPLPFDWYKWVAVNLVIAMALTTASRSFS